MLQQTQVMRVIPKYEMFTARFPDVKSLAGSGLAEVLQLWSGLGYNRRAKYLHAAAKALKDSEEPWKFEDLVAQKGIGNNTAAAVLVYSYGQRLVFVETNIRTVMIHHFFHDDFAVPDRDIIEAVRRTLPEGDYRNWYYALMDYGAYLKAVVGNASKQSAAYSKQPAFHGSKRQLRGKILKLLGGQQLSRLELESSIKDERLGIVLDELKSERMIHEEQGRYFLG